MQSSEGEFSRRHIITWALDDLGRDDFKRFKFELRDEIVPELIPEEFLSDAAREDLAKEMIQRYTEKDALELTFRILERMGKRGLLEKVKSRCLHIRAVSTQDEAKLNRVLESHKDAMKRRFEFIHEGTDLKKRRKLSEIFTQLHVTEGESEDVNYDHEVLQISPASGKRASAEVNYSGMFKEEHVRTVMTKGIGGIGKTFSVQRFVLDWAEGKANEDIKFMFLLPFRDLNIIRAKTLSLHKCLVKFYPELEELDNPDIFYECKLMFIFDGLDESKLKLDFQEAFAADELTVDIMVSKLIQGSLLPKAKIWITARPASSGRIPSEYISQVTEVQGLRDPEKEEYFRRRISDQTKANRIISHIRSTRSLHIMCHIPLFCWITAAVLGDMFDRKQMDGQNLPTTLTEMFIHFLLVQTNVMNKKIHGSYLENKQELLKGHKDMILRLAKLAFTHLEKSNFMFSEHDLTSLDINVDEAAVYSGICTKISQEDSLFFRENMYCFVHPTIQEFFAALHIFHSYVVKNKIELKSFLKVARRWCPFHDLLHFTNKLRPF